MFNPEKPQFEPQPKVPKEKKEEKAGKTLEKKEVIEEKIPSEITPEKRLELENNFTEEESKILTSGEIKEIGQRREKYEEEKKKRGKLKRAMAWLTIGACALPAAVGMFSEKARAGENRQVLREQITTAEGTREELKIVPSPEEKFAFNTWDELRELAKGDPKFEEKETQEKLSQSVQKFAYERKLLQERAKTGKIENKDYDLRQKDVITAASYLSSKHLYLYLDQISEYGNRNLKADANEWNKFSADEGGLLYNLYKFKSGLQGKENEKVRLSFLNEGYEKELSSSGKLTLKAWEKLMKIPTKPEDFDSKQQKLMAEDPTAMKAVIKNLARLEIGQFAARLLNKKEVSPEDTHTAYMFLGRALPIYIDQKSEYGNKDGVCRGEEKLKFTTEQAAKNNIAFQYFQDNYEAMEK